MEKENQKIKDYIKNYIDRDSRSNRLDTESFAVLPANRVGSFLQTI